MSWRKNERGNVLVEFIVIALFLIIPITYLTVQGAFVGRTYISMTSITAMATRAFVTQSSDALGRKNASFVVSRGLKSSNLDHHRITSSIKCTDTPCLSPGGFVTVMLSGKVEVAVPFLPPLSVPVKVAQTLAVDGYR